MQLLNNERGLNTYKKDALSLVYICSLWVQFKYYCSLMMNSVLHLQNFHSKKGAAHERGSVQCEGRVHIFFSMATLVYLPGATVAQFPLVVVKDNHVM